MNIGTRSRSRSIEHTQYDVPVGKEHTKSQIFQTKLSSRFTSVWGFGALGIYILGYTFANSLPHAYKPNSIKEWWVEAVASPNLLEASSLSFIVSNLLLIPFFHGLSNTLLSAIQQAPSSSVNAKLEHQMSTKMASGALSTAALLKAIGAVAPFVFARYVLPLGTAVEQFPLGVSLLGFYLTLDSAFYAMSGLGLILFSLTMHATTIAVPTRQAMFPRWLGPLGFIAGLTSLPIAFQAFYNVFSIPLLFAGPLFMAWVGSVSYSLWTSHH